MLNRCAFDVSRAWRHPITIAFTESVGHGDKRTLERLEHIRELTRVVALFTGFHFKQQTAEDQETQKTNTLVEIFSLLSVLICHVTETDTRWSVTWHCEADVNKNSFHLGTLICIACPQRTDQGGTTGYRDYAGLTPTLHNDHYRHQILAHNDNDLSELAYISFTV